MKNDCHVTIDPKWLSDFKSDKDQKQAQTNYTVEHKTNHYLNKKTIIGFWLIGTNQNRNKAANKLAFV